MIFYLTCLPLGTATPPTPPPHYSPNRTPTQPRQASAKEIYLDMDVTDWHRSKGATWCPLLALIITATIIATSIAKTNVSNFTENPCPLDLSEFGKTWSSFLAGGYHFCKLLRIAEILTGRKSRKKKKQFCKLAGVGIKSSVHFVHVPEAPRSLQKELKGEAQGAHYQRRIS